jgi:hypothetical protein
MCNKRASCCRCIQVAAAAQRAEQEGTAFVVEEGLQSIDEAFQRVYGEQQQDPTVKLQPVTPAPPAPNLPGASSLPGMKSYPIIDAELIAAYSKVDPLAMCVLLLVPDAASSVAEGS